MTLSGVVVFYKATDKVGGSLLNGEIMRKGEERDVLVHPAVYRPLEEDW